MLRYKCENKGIRKKKLRIKYVGKKFGIFFFKLDEKKFWKMKVWKKVCEKFRNFFFS